MKSTAIFYILTSKYFDYSTNDTVILLPLLSLVDTCVQFYFNLFVHDIVKSCTALFLSLSTRL